MVIPEVHTLIERAAAARERLVGLLEVLPAEYWERRAPDDRWCVRDHAAHTAAVDELVTELLRGASGEAALWLGDTGDPAVLHALRERRRVAFAEEPPAPMIAAMGRARDGVVGALVRMDGAALDLPLFVAGVVNGWGQPIGFTLRTYLAQWAVHDLAHDAAIREAIRQPLAPGDIVAGARIRR